MDHIINWWEACDKLPEVLEKEGYAQPQSPHVVAFFEKQLLFAVIILGFATICVFLLSDFKANIDSKPTPICFENELTWDMGYNEKFAFE